MFANGRLSSAALRALRVLPAEEAVVIPPEERPEDQLTPAELQEALRRVCVLCSVSILTSLVDK